MSSWSDYHCGALTDEEYKFCMRRECGDNDEDHEIEFDEEETDEEDDCID